MTRHIVMFSGGIGSWATAKRVAEKHGAENMILLFSDVKGFNTSPHVGEDEDTYRFLRDAAENVGAPLVTVRDGRDIWQVFKDKRFLGNSRVASCSHELKQKPARAWLDANCAPDDSVVYVGIDWTELHRLPAIKRNYLPYVAEAPLTVEPFLDKREMIEWAASEGLRPPRLYEMGFSHNNCGGGCVRAGQAQFRKLFMVMPERFAEWEAQENAMREFLDKPVSILTELVNGEKRNLPLIELRKRIDEQPSLLDEYDFGGCGCFVDFVDAE